MACVTGKEHTIFLSDEGILHSLGNNFYGQLGLVHNNNVTIPTAIPNLSRIHQVSCGYFFTICVDYDGHMWSFGYNAFGQLGTGNVKNYSTPQKIKEIPPVESISCGYGHTLILTTNKHLWSVGFNEYGQLLLGNTINHCLPQKTKYSNILKISAGNTHSLIQENNGNIFVGGENFQGQLGLGHNKKLQVSACLIPNQPPNIIEFCGGYNYSLFLDDEGKVFSVGSGMKGCLGIGIVKNRNQLTQILNIPPMQMISVVGNSSYFLDFDGNIWCCGDNQCGQLGLWDFNDRITPIQSFKNAKQISCGSHGSHFLLKDSGNKILIMGENIGLGLDEPISIPQELEAENIWGTQISRKSLKSARK